MDFVLGIDGGGTKTAAVILSLEGNVIGYGEAGASTYGVVPPMITRNHIEAAVRQACLQAGISVPTFKAAFLGLGNVVSEADRLAIREIAQDLGLAEPEKMDVDHDIRVALAGGLSGRPGIVLILGTGASCYGLNEMGQTWRSGGWGPLIDDGGSGYWLGIQAMHAAVADFDGRGKATQLASSVKSELKLTSMDELMNRLYAQNMSRTEISRLAKLVFAAALNGDEVAHAILQQGCDLLADCVSAVARKLAMDDHPSEVALVGGLTRAGSIYLGPLHRAILARLPECQVHLAEMSPVLGAGLLALKILTSSLPDSVIKKIHETSKDFLTSIEEPTVIH